MILFDAPLLSGFKYTSPLTALPLKNKIFKPASLAAATLS